MGVSRPWHLQDVGEELAALAPGIDRRREAALHHAIEHTDETDCAGALCDRLVCTGVLDISDKRAHWRWQIPVEVAAVEDGAGRLYHHVWEDAKPVRD